MLISVREAETRQSAGSLYYTPMLWGGVVCVCVCVTADVSVCACVFENRCEEKTEEGRCVPHMHLQCKVAYNSVSAFIIKVCVPFLGEIVVNA